MLDRVFLEHHQCVGEGKRCACIRVDGDVRVKIGTGKNDYQRAVRVSGPEASNGLGAAAGVQCNQDFRLW